MQPHCVPRSRTNWVKLVAAVDLSKLFRSDAARSRTVSGSGSWHSSSAQAVRTPSSKRGRYLGSSPKAENPDSKVTGGIAQGLAARLAAPTAAANAHCSRAGWSFIVCWRPRPKSRSAAPGSAHELARERYSPARCPFHSSAAARIQDELERNSSKSTIPERSISASARAAASDVRAPVSAKARTNAEVPKVAIPSFAPKRAAPGRHSKEEVPSPSRAEWG